ncbi:alpha/beta hydrolase [Silvibacterium acidisoli]|uniref:alpha/beta hydrolase n=1 Tax=Acidobacteriaceae bacterium ZG23-2 TaxID=2883246 RepID=UPI00406C3183
MNTVRRLRSFVLIALMVAVCAQRLTAQTAASQLVNREIHSTALAHSKIGTDPVRKLAIYLPAGYDGSKKRYPVLYYLDNSSRAIFDQQHAQQIFDRSIASGIMQPFLLVCIDGSTPIGSSWYVNSSATGNWDDYMVQEVVPYIDANFRTLPTRNSRGITGNFMAAHGALRMGMVHADIFGIVYAMHPVGTGSGLRIMDSLPDLNLMANARSLDDVRRDVYSTIFTSIFEAFLPDPAKPPLYIDLPAHRDGDKLVIDSALTARLRDGFFLESLIPQYADNLKSLRALKIDWARSDQNQDHVYSNQALTHKLNEFSIVHEAEEFNGAWGESYWGDDGRIVTEVLPFFARHMIFAAETR